MKNGLQGSHADAYHVFDARPRRGHAVTILPTYAPHVEGTPPKLPAPARVFGKHLNASFTSLLVRLSSSLASSLLSAPECGAAMDGANRAPQPTFLASAPPRH
jgi:hypothetical protein